MIRYFFPLLLAVQIWTWTPQGYGHGWQYPDVPTTALDAVSAWHYDWSPTCAEPQHVPMAWDDGAWRLPYLRACNDGRPLLIWNEPDLRGISPAQVAELVHDLSTWWQGEVWCCGTLAANVEYVEQVVDVYERQYSAWPATGWHVHAYIRYPWWSDVPADPASAEDALRLVDRFQATMTARDILGHGIILSEYGQLSTALHPTDLVPLYETFQAGIARRPYIISAAWFAAWEPSVNAGNLLTADGALTELGRAWQQTAMR